MKKISAIAQTFILTSFSALSLFAAPVQAASFRGLGFLYSSNLYSYPWGVSADGSVVVGTSSISNSYFEEEAFRWTQESGMVGLGSLGGSNLYGAAKGVSADGSIIVGESQNANGSPEAFRWTQKSGMVGLGFFSGYDPDPSSFATSVSADGSIIVGSSQSVVRSAEAFRWTQESGMVGLGFPPPSSCLPPDTSSCTSSFIWANGISADGSVIVGQGLIVGANVRVQVPFIWTHAGGISGLDEGIANEVSANGSVIVGLINGKAFRWTQESGLVGLDDHANPDELSVARGVSADGSIIVGNSNFIHGIIGTNEPFLWTQKKGVVSLKDTLIGAGLDVSGWDLGNATAISADGFTIVGYGLNPSGQTEAWAANLSPEPIPEPLTILGSMAAIAFAAGFERKFSKNKSDEKDPDA